jgi:excisionase family DNA binding protein
MREPSQGPHHRNASSDHVAEPDVVPARRFYTVTEAAQLLRLSAPTIYREIRAGRFPAIRVRGRYVIPAKALDAMEQAALEEAGRVGQADATSVTFPLR